MRSPIDPVTLLVVVGIAGALVPRTNGFSLVVAALGMTAWAVIEDLRASGWPELSFGQRQPAPARDRRGAPDISLDWMKYVLAPIVPAILVASAIPILVARLGAPMVHARQGTYLIGLFFAFYAALCTGMAAIEALRALEPLPPTRLRRRRGRAMCRPVAMLLLSGIAVGFVGGIARV